MSNGIIQDQLREEMPLDGDEWEAVTDTTKLLEKPYVKTRPPAQGAPAPRPEQMDNPCPNFFHGRLAHVVREPLELHFDVALGACDLHKSLMLRCRSEWGQYSKPKIIEDCVQVIEQAVWKLPTGAAVRNEIKFAVRKATRAISDLSPKVLLDYEVQHWDYLGSVRPQHAYMAHAMAGGGRYGDFCNPKFVQQWPHFIYSVLNI
jgi:hypothetical protein